MESIKTVWIVDDDEKFCHILMQILEQNVHYNVIGMSNTLKDAYMKLAKHTPDLVTVDLSLPDGNGVELIKWLDLNLPDIHKIIVSFWGQENLVFDAFMHGVNGYIQKDHLLTMEIDKALMAISMGGTQISPKLATKVLNYFHSQHNYNKVETVSSAPVGEYSASFSETTALCDAGSQAVFFLTAQENAVLEKLIQGLDYDEVADDLHMEKDAVANHIKTIYQKLNMSAKLSNKSTVTTHLKDNA